MLPLPSYQGPPHKGWCLGGLWTREVDQSQGVPSSPGAGFLLETRIWWQDSLLLMFSNLSPGCSAPIHVPPTPTPQPVTPLVILKRRLWVSQAASCIAGKTGYSHIHTYSSGKNQIEMLSSGSGQSHFGKEVMQVNCNSFSYPLQCITLGLFAPVMCQNASADPQDFQHSPLICGWLSKPVLCKENGRECLYCSFHGVPALKCL